MARQTLNIGTAANDGTGDNLRVGGDKINDNFSEIYSAFGDGSTLSSLAVTAMNNATANEILTVGATTTELDAEANLTFDGTTLTVTGNITVPNDGDIGSVGATDAIQISSAGIVTFKDDILIKDGGTIGNATTAAAIQIEADGDIVLSDDLYISGGLLDLKNEGSVSQIKLYCESSNAHAQTLQSAPHSLASSAVCVLPTQSGTLIGTGDTGTLPLVAIDIDGGTDIGAALATTDLIIVDDGAGGTNRKAALSRVVTLTESSATALAIALG